MTLICCISATVSLKDIIFVQREPACWPGCRAKTDVK